MYGSDRVTIFVDREMLSWETSYFQGTSRGAYPSIEKGEGGGERGNLLVLFSYKILVLGIVNTIEMPEIPLKLPVVARQLLEHR